MIDFTHLIGNLHFRFITLIRLTLEENKLDEINSSQVMVLLAIEEREVKSSELVSRGFYQYGIYKLVDHGYLTWNPNLHDRRSGFFKITSKGLRVVKLFQQLFREQKERVEKSITNEEFSRLVTVLGQIDSFYVEQTNHPRPMMENR